MRTTKKERALAVARINWGGCFASYREKHGCNPPKRITLKLYRDSDGYRWYGIDNDLDSEGASDTGISAKTISGAKANATAAWSGSAWDLRARWIY